MNNIPAHTWNGRDHATIWGGKFMVTNLTRAVESDKTERVVGERETKIAKFN